MTNLQKLIDTPSETLIALYRRLHSKSAVLTTLGISSRDGRARQELSNKLNGLQLRGRPTYTFEQLTQAFQQAQCWADVYNQLGLTKWGYHKKGIIKAAQNWMIDIPVFDVTTTFLRNKKVFTKEQIFCQNSDYQGSVAHAARKFNVLSQPECSKCHQGEVWQGEALKITLDHINGIHNDNRPENLRWLCPNCHSQTETFGSKNKKNIHRI